MSHSVSVIIPTYNGARYIGAALESVYGQTLPPREIIVVDDCSKDGTAEVVEEIEKKAPLPVRLIRLMRNSGGPTRPINTGVAAARTELVAVLDQDDVFTPEKIEVEADILSRNPDASLAAGFCSAWDNPSCIHSTHIEVFQQLGGLNSTEAVTLRGEDVLRSFILHGNFLVGYPAFMFRVSHWRTKGGLDERLRVASDYDFLCWLCTQGSIIIDPKVHYIRREHDANVCNNRQKMFLDTARVRARYLASQRWLLKKDDVSRPMREWFAGFSYWLREAGNYRGAWECCRLAAKVWGWDWPLGKAVCKLGVYFVRRGLTRQSPVYSSLTMPRSPSPGAAARDIV